MKHRYRIVMAMTMLAPLFLALSAFHSRPLYDTNRLESSAEVESISEVEKAGDAIAIPTRTGYAFSGVNNLIALQNESSCPPGFLTLSVGQGAYFTLSGCFYLEGPLSYSVSTGNSAVSASVFAGSVAISGVHQGKAAVWITATDASGNTQTIATIVTVTPGSPGPPGPDDT